VHLVGFTIEIETGCSRTTIVQRGHCPYHMMTASEPLFVAQSSYSPYASVIHIGLTKIQLYMHPHCIYT